MQMIFFLQGSALNMDVNNKLYDDIFSFVFVPSKYSQLGLVLMVGKPNNIIIPNKLSLLVPVDAPCSVK